MQLKRMRRLLLLSALVLVPYLRADVTLPALFSDGMVVQRNLPIHVWGMATPGENVTVTLGQNSQSASADRLGHWHVYLPPRGAGGPFEVTAHGANTIVLRDVLVGDVWIASGQSNMEFPMRQVANAEAEIAAANLPRVRLLEVRRAHAESPQEDIVSSGWSTCSPQSVRNFSAVAYYFAREISTRENVPVGVIGSYWGGSVAEAWTSLRALAADPALSPLFAVYARMMGDAADTARLRKIEAAEVESARAKNLPVPKVPWRPEPHLWQPGALFNGMIAPLTPFAIRGVIWYQGESNSIIARAPHLYERQFQTLIRDWRDHWGQGDFPFLYVQIANFTATPEEDWPAIREAQRKALSLNNTGMAVTIDLGSPDDVHPTNKRDVGLRLALIARAKVYGKAIEYSGPLFRQIVREPHALRVFFDHVGGGLQLKDDPSLLGFEVAGGDATFRPASALIDGTTVVVSSTAVADPVAVRYAWSNSPRCNLYNRAGLPASPFAATLPPMH